MKLKQKIETSCIILLSVLLVLNIVNLGLTLRYQNEMVVAQGEGYIKWVEFDIPYTALEKALNIDINTHKDDKDGISWVTILSCLGAKYGGNWKQYRARDMDKIVAGLQDGKTPEELLDFSKYLSYYEEAYTAVLGGFVGKYEKEVPDKEHEGQKLIEPRYGLKVYSPIAEGFGYSHYDDFGNSRTYGYRRQHLGNDLIGSVGTPIVAIEGGTVEVMGWNQYGGWRIGIRSFDGKRSYYYAHLRKNNPYHANLEVGKTVRAGDVIGYLGMTGYSTKENVNNMSTPHLHVGMQLVFDESQKEGTNQIWINMYHIVELLSRNKATVQKDELTKQYDRVYNIYDPLYPPEMRSPKGGNATNHMQSS